MNQVFLPSKAYRWSLSLIAAAACFLFYFLLPAFPQGKAFVFFAGLAILMEFWEVELPKLPRIQVVEALYVSSLFLFPLPLVAGLIVIGGIFKFLYFARADLRGELLLLRRILLFGSSVILFSKIGLYGAFTSFAGKPILEQFSAIGGQLAVFAVWILGYSVAQSVLSQCERMILRGSVRISPNWSGYGHSILFNLFLIAPLGLLMYILYELQSLPLPYPLLLLIPSLLVIHRSIKTYTESLEAAKSTIEALAEAVDKRLDFTHDHAPNVSRFARRISMAMGLSDENVELVERAARIHNLGKVGIADRILNKKEGLTDEEFKIVKKHPEIGARVASQLSIYEREVEIIRSHHESFDGSGYPRGLKGEAIPLGARIVAVADAYVAMVSGRPYREAFTPDGAVAQIKEGMGIKFDPKVVEAFLQIVDRESIVKR